MQVLRDGTVEKQVHNVTATDAKVPRSFISFENDAVLVAALCLLELLVFAPFVRDVGFYLDDWLMLCTLHFGPQNLFGAFANYFFNDPKVIIRPVEVLHFAPMYFLFGLKPLGYHIVNGLLEMLCAGFMYAALKRFTQSRLLAFVSVAAFILYPIRDCTHYWILCSSVALSLSLYLWSLLISMKAVTARKPLYYGLAVVPFLFSIYNYEVFMPLAVVTALCVFFMFKRTDTFSFAFKQAAFSFAPLFAAGVSLYIYQRKIVPHLGTSFMHKVDFDPMQVLHVITSGIFVSSPLHALPFFQSQVKLLLTEPLSALSVLSLLVIFAGTAVCSYKIQQSESWKFAALRAAELAAVGITAIVLSLSIFGLNAEYEPTLMTLVNRIFTGPAFGWGCIFATMIYLIACAVSSIKDETAKRAGFALIAGVLSISAVYLTLANWELAQPWVASHRAQKDMLYLMKQRLGKVKHPDVIVLTDSPRYVMWSPVFDGVWDFQSMVRLALEDEKIRAGVVSERLVLFNNDVRDISMGYTCATYPFEKLKVFIPASNSLVSTASGEEFVSLIEKNSEKTQLAPGTVEKWKQQLNELNAKTLKSGAK